MKRVCLSCVVVAGLLAQAPAMADVQFSVGIGVPVVIGLPMALVPQPVYVAPVYAAPVYVPPPRYVAPRPVVVLPQLAYSTPWYERQEYVRRGWSPRDRGGDRGEQRRDEGDNEE